MPEKQRVLNFFSYPLPAVTLAAGAAGGETIRIESATDFLWFKSTFWADDDPVTLAQTAATRVLPSWDVQVQVSGTDRNLFQQALPLPALFGSGEIPFVLPAPLVLYANSEVRFDFTSRDTRDLRVVPILIGLKDYGDMMVPGEAAERV